MIGPIIIVIGVTVSAVEFIVKHRKKAVATPATSETKTAAEVKSVVSSDVTPPAA